MKLTAALCCLSLALAACSNLQPSTPMRGDVAARGLVPTRALPAQLPTGAVAVPGTQYLIVNADSAAAELVDMLIPVPFVTDMAMEGLHRRAAQGFRLHDAQVDPFAITMARLAGSPLMAGRPDALALKPWVYLVEGSDQQWRLSLTFHVEGAAWTGRYMYHLPTTYGGAEIQHGSAAMLNSLRNELVAGSDMLRELMQRDARGALQGTGTRVEFGSYHVVGSDMMGVMPARLVRFTDAELVEESENHVVLRSRGDLNAAANEGALAFGVHYFRKDQLHDFKKLARSAN